MTDIPENINIRFSNLDLQSEDSENEGVSTLNNGINEPNEGDKITVQKEVPDLRGINKNVSNEVSNLYDTYANIFNRFNMQFAPTNARENGDRSILELTDLELMFIAYKLKLQSKLKFAKVCRRFRESVQKALLAEYCHILNSQDLYHSNLDLEDFFSLAGIVIRSYITKGNYGTFALMNYEHHLTALKTIHFRKHDLDPGYLPKLLPNMDYIVKLYFYRCEFDDEDSHAFSLLPNLTHLSIIENEEILGHHIYLCTKLVELSLRKCKKVEVSNFANIFYTLKGIEVLDVVDCCQVAYDEIFYNLKSLRKISLSCNLERIRYWMLADMPTVNEIEIACYRVDLTQELLEALLEVKAKELLCLKITYPKKIQVSLQQQTSLVSKFTNLRQLSWRSMCSDDIYFDWKIFEEMPYLNCVCLVDVGEFSIEDFGDMIRQCHFLIYIDVRFCEFITNEYIFEAILALVEREEEKQLLYEDEYFRKQLQLLKIHDQKVQQEEQRQNPGEQEHQEHQQAQEQKQQEEQQQEQQGEQQEQEQQKEQQQQEQQGEQQEQDRRQELHEREQPQEQQEHDQQREQQEEEQQQELQEHQEQQYETHSDLIKQYVPKPSIIPCVFIVYGTNVTEEVVNDLEFEESKEYLFLDFTNRCNEESDSDGEFDSEGEEWLENEDYYYISDLYSDA